MNRRNTVTTGIIVLCAALWAAPAVGADKAAEKAAEHAASSWLALMDAGRYGESWKEASSLFKKQVTPEQWEAAARGARGPLGALRSRKLISARYMTSLPGAPDGEYVVIQYDATFENKKAAVETITPMKEKDGSWKVSGYYVR
jgi:hypothetical protein